MNRDELIFNTKGLGFDSVICQKDIKTEEDVQKCLSDGYAIAMTESDFKSKYSIDTRCVYYSKAFSMEIFYFNPDTLAAIPLNVVLMNYLGADIDISSTLSLIESREKQVLQNIYFDSIMTLTDAMRLDYFKFLVDKKKYVEDLYSLFMSVYKHSDYGFNSIDYDTFKYIISKKTSVQKRSTTISLKSFPDVIKVYRGGNSKSTSYKEAFSWTLDKNIAYFFATRLGTGPAYVVEGEISKKDVIEYIVDRGEKEVIVYPDKVRNTKEISLYGLDYLSKNLPVVTTLYQKYRDKLNSMFFFKGSDDHDKAHEARVALLCLLMGHELKVSTEDLNILATAAIYHDVGRNNDSEDTKHGAVSSDIYKRTLKIPNRIVEFLCEYHCRQDSDGFAYISEHFKKDEERVSLLYKIFKDADGLDRVRFGIKQLDVNYLRTDVAKVMPLVARLCYENIKV